MLLASVRDVMLLNTNLTVLRDSVDTTSVAETILGPRNSTFGAKRWTGFSSEKQG